MQIADLFRSHQPSISFEFFPPRTEKGAESLLATIHELKKLNPSFVSVTYGAGGSTRDLTHRLVLRILQETSIPAVPHLTCTCHNAPEIETILNQYAEAGVGTILALRGDPPREMPDYDRSQDTFPYASDLIRFIQEFNRSGQHPSGGFGIGVAGFPEGHPETQNRMKEMDYLKAKIDAGVDYICTQLFFDNHDFLDFRERCHLAGITVPIIAGIMPITTPGGMVRMAELAAGVHFPAKLQRDLTGLEDNPEAFAKAGTTYATEQCRELIEEGVEGLHFYTLNKSGATRQIAADLELGGSRQ
ncbi:MAG: methylenetetrahydrofolate reductase [NAD(P)H] [Roseibacillus sp.]|jgi:methylenetetrahydrofolate reductase (NADPH)|nr:methylenetetrahydrofolate reductase [NAD(P)H] [Roseibacillus sp.]MBP36614.1 methylenetetrahydrofolate reductase [NAD(P)H] [Roseibacillus sp.]MCP4729440.1 methylenetetrahydrofolate reductase [NAD(P)H] [Roseibacillus sp.]MDP7309314.1 methylenetetrahydrofolate reductase [NAD(P)H] [Roseibacillus sp.]MDP7496191.1 methylenetetrahydrofolate reductase [NAD(P)H] [Roseibacillus sp.]|tara:strand:- start:1351 stop:2256 length:906 start_codon:yes stop_codon:yes gene_type:complete